MKKRRISESRFPKIPKRSFIGISFFAMTLLLFSLASCDSDDDSGSLPLTTTVSVTDITDVSAVVNGTVTSNGGSKILAMGVCWLPGNAEPTIDDNFVPVGEYTQNGILEEEWDYSVVFNKLSALTEYSVRSYVANAAGVSYGETIMFSTKAGKTIHVLTADMIDCYTQEVWEGAKENLVDGDPETYWHSAWSNDEGAEVMPLPHHVQITFAEAKNIGGFTFMTRSPSGRGIDPAQFDVQVSTDGVTYTTVWSSERFDAKLRPDSNTFDLDKNYSSKYFRIRILDTRTPGQTCTTMAELQVFENGLLDY